MINFTTTRRSTASTFLVLLTLGMALLAGCGGGSGESSASPDTPDGAAQAFIDAVADGDGATACELVSADGEDLAVTSVTGVSAGSSCEDTVSAVPDDVRDAMGSFETETTDEAAGKATVQVSDGNGGGTPVDLEMVKDGEEWDVNGLAGF